MSLRFFLNADAYHKPLKWDTPWFIALILGTLYVTSSLVRFYWSSLLPCPVVMVDELMYKAAAESFFRFGDFDRLYLGYRPIFGNFLYPSIISLSFYFGPNFYVISKAINAVLISIAIFPTFLIAKCFNQGKWPLLPVILVMLMPSNLYANYIMAESLFFPLFLFAFFLSSELFTVTNLKMKWEVVCALRYFS